MWPLGSPNQLNFFMKCFNWKRMSCCLKFYVMQWNWSISKCYLSVHILLVVIIKPCLSGENENHFFEKALEDWTRLIKDKLPVKVQFSKTPWLPSSSLIISKHQASPLSQSNSHFLWMAGWFSWCAVNVLCSLSFLSLFFLPSSPISLSLYLPGCLWNGQMRTRVLFTLRNRYGAS